MKFIYVNNVNNHIIVDDEDFDKVNKYKWFGRIKINTIYAETHVIINGERKLVQLHRFILNLKVIDPDIDHINGNGLDCRRLNMRFATKQQNAANTTKQVNNTSGYKGVSFHKRKEKYIAHIGVDGKLIHLGYFDSVIDAALAYNKAAIKYFGAFAYVNQV